MPLPGAAAGEAARISPILISREENRRENPLKNTLHGARPFRARSSFLCQSFFMSSATTDLWGQDIALDDAGQARVAANGELVLTDGVETGVQDIKLRLFTRLGSLFYDLDFGSLISDWFYEDSTATTRAAFLAEVTMRVEADPRVVVGSVKSRLLAWDERSIAVAVEWRFIDEDQPLNLVLQLDKSVRELVIRDGRFSDPEAAI